MNDERLRDIARKMEDIAGHYFGRDLDEIATVLANDHPTHQQSFMRFCVAYIRALSLHDFTDARNDAAVKLARRLVETLHAEDVDTYLPFI